MKKLNIKQKMLLAAGALTSGSALADASAAMASIAAEATSLADAAWPIATGIVVAVIGIKLFKKFANRAT